VRGAPRENEVVRVVFFLQASEDAEFARRTDWWGRAVTGAMIVAFDAIRAADLDGAFHTTVLTVAGRR